MSHWQPEVRQQCGISSDRILVRRRLVLDISVDSITMVKWIVRISRFALAALFLFTAVAKLAVITTFAANVNELLNASGFSGRRWSWVATISVIALELVVALLFLLRRTVRLAAVLAAVLLTGFAAYALYYVYVLHGEPLECGCFGGIIASQLGIKTALRNLALLIPAFIVWFGFGRENRRQPNTLELDPAKVN